MPARVVRVITRMQNDPSGRENTLTAIREAIKYYRQRHPGLLKLVVWTDESGDDLDQLEQIIQLCKTEKVSVTVIGPSAVLGCPKGTHAWYSPERRSYYQLPVEKGPEGGVPVAAVGFSLADVSLGPIGRF